MLVLVVVVALVMAQEPLSISKESQMGSRTAALLQRVPMVKKQQHMDIQHQNENNRQKQQQQRQEKQQRQQQQQQQNQQQQKPSRGKKGRLSREQMFELLDTETASYRPSFEERMGRIFSYHTPYELEKVNQKWYGSEAKSTSSASFPSLSPSSAFVNELSFHCQPLMSDSNNASTPSSHPGQESFLRWNEEAVRYVFRSVIAASAENRCCKDSLPLAFAYAQQQHKWCMVLLHAYEVYL